MTLSPPSAPRAPRAGLRPPPAVGRGGRPLARPAAPPRASAPPPLAPPRPPPHGELVEGVDREIPLLLQEILDLGGRDASERRRRNAVGRREVRHHVTQTPSLQAAGFVPGLRCRVLDGAAEGFPLGLGDP